MARCEPYHSVLIQAGTVLCATVPRVQAGEASHGFGGNDSCLGACGDNRLHHGSRRHRRYSSDCSAHLDRQGLIYTKPRPPCCRRSCSPAFTAFGCFNAAARLTGGLASRSASVRLGSVLLVRLSMLGRCHHPEHRDRVGHHRCRCLCPVPGACAYKQQARGGIQRQHVDARGHRRSLRIRIRNFRSRRPAVFGSDHANQWICSAGGHRHRFRFRRQFPVRSIDFCYAALITVFELVGVSFVQHEVCHGRSRDRRDAGR